MKIMHQNWGKLLFMHWPIDAGLLRPLIPPALEIDTYDGSAWIAIVPFTMWDIRPLPPYMPPVPGLAAMHELNVRTYVQIDGEPGVWFFSLDCNSRAAVLAARTFFFLPYYNADIDLKQEGQTIDYTLKRTDSPSAAFSARWEIGAPLPTAEPGSLEFFLTERYCLYSARKEKIYRARIQHQPWPLQRAEVSAFSSTIIEASGLPELTSEPLLHYAEELSVEIWPLSAAARAHSPKK
ncbi:MAG TPA: DUF2071 domain-containing protein [Pyrinomonadaceae bacterium]|nr:DUF2071 domain-containing protein [Pyrinomonadaceae bacterium]